MFATPTTNPKYSADDCSYISHNPARSSLRDSKQKLPQCCSDLAHNGTMPGTTYGL